MLLVGRVIVIKLTGMDDGARCWLEQAVAEVQGAVGSEVRS